MPFDATNRFTYEMPASLPVATSETSFRLSLDLGFRVMRTTYAWWPGRSRASNGVKMSAAIVKLKVPPKRMAEKAEAA